MNHEIISTTSFGLIVIIGMIIIIYNIYNHNRYYRISALGVIPSNRDLMSRRKLPSFLN